MTKLATDPTLLAALKRAASRSLTPQEEHDQRLSFVMASLPDENNLTREQVQDVLDKRHPAWSQSHDRI